MSEIQPRDLKFHVSDNAVRHWYRGDMATTALIDCFAVMLPVGERFFICWLKHFEPKIKCEALRDEMRGFYQQEAFHSREHADYNAGMTKLGYDAPAMEAYILAVAEANTTSAGGIAATCAIEHMTTTFSRTLLRNPDLLDGTPDAYRNLWLWQALEELEHRSVALDVYAEVLAHIPAWKRYLLRIMAMNINFVKLTGAYIHNLRLYAKADGVRPGFRFTLRCLYISFIAPGFVRKGLPYFLKYYLPWYDPKGADKDNLVEKWQAEYQA